MAALWEELEIYKEERKGLFDGTDCLFFEVHWLEELHRPRQIIQGRWKKMRLWKWMEPALEMGRSLGDKVGERMTCTFKGFSFQL